MNIHKEPWAWMDSFDKLPKRRNMDIRFRLWNARSLYRVGSIGKVSRELSKGKLDLVIVQEVRWVGGGTEPAGEYTFFHGKGNENHELGTRFLCIRESYQQLRELSCECECVVSDRISYIILGGRWCHERSCPTEDETDDVKNSFYEELERLFDKFIKYSYHMKILLEDFNAKVRRENIFKSTIGNESSHEISNDNGFRLVNFDTSENLRVRSTMLLHHNIHTYLDVSG
jgi:hypothetical protein